MQPKRSSLAAVLIHVDPLYRVSPLEGLKTLLDNKVEILYEQGCSNYDEPIKDDRLKRAVAAAKKADVAFVFVGYPETFETEGRDRPDMRLTGQQDALVEAVAEANPKTVVILNAGAPVSMPWIDQVAAVVLAYYPGQENGNAVAGVLLGIGEPFRQAAGHLPQTPGR